MDFDTIRPIVSGVLGGIAVAWLATRWVRRLPHADNRAKQRALTERQKNVARCANAGAGVGIGTRLVLYLGGFLSSDDWRGLGLAAGLTALLPLLVILIGNLRCGAGQIREGFSAFAISQKTPAVVLYTLMGLMLAGGLWATVAFLSQSNNAEQIGGATG